MTKNIGKAEKTIRIVVALMMPILFVTGIASGVFSYIVLAIGGILLLTALVDFCPLYAVLKMKGTKKIT